MAPEQLFLQLGVAGALIFIGYRVALRALTNAREADRERTAALRETDRERTLAIGAAFSSLNVKLDSYALNGQEQRAQMLIQVSRFESKLDEIMTWQERTPVGGGPFHHEPTQRGIKISAVEEAADRDRSEGGVVRDELRGGYSIRRPSSAQGIPKLAKKS